MGLQREDLEMKGWKHFYSFMDGITLNSYQKDRYLIYIPENSTIIGLYFIKEQYKYTDLGTVKIDDIIDISNSNNNNYNYSVGNCLKSIYTGKCANMKRFDYLCGYYNINI